MWNPFRRKKNKQTGFEAACALVGLEPTAIPDFIDAFVIADGDIPVVVVQTGTRPSCSLTDHPMFAGSVNYGQYWRTQFLVYPEFQDKARELAKRTEKRSTFG